MKQELSNSEQTRLIREWAAAYRLWNEQKRAHRRAAAGRESVEEKKVIADRPKDWADIEGVLIEQRGRLDQTYIRTWLMQFAEMLERPDWLDRFQSLVRQVGD